MTEKIHPPFNPEETPQELLEEIQKTQEVIKELEKKGHKIGERQIVFAENISREEMLKPQFIELFNAIKHALGVERFKDKTEKFKKEFPETCVEKFFEAETKEKKTLLRMIRFKNGETTIIAVSRGSNGEDQI